MDKPDINPKLIKQWDTAPPDASQLTVLGHVVGYADRAVFCRNCGMLACADTGYWFHTHQAFAVCGTRLKLESLHGVDGVYDKNGFRPHKFRKEVDAWSPMPLASLDSTTL